MRSIADRSLAELATRHPRTAALFDQLGLDYCCHGERSLAEACVSAGLDVREVEDALTAERPRPEARVPVTPLELVDDILATHHAYLWTELPALERLAAKVVGVHGGRHRELRDVDRIVHELRDDLEPHMRKEERVLFPAIRALYGGRREFPFGSVQNPIATMRVEHEQVGALLADLRTVTKGYAIPDDACGSYRALYERLTHLESDTHLHIHTENNVLFPAVVAEESIA